MIAAACTTRYHSTAAAIKPIEETSGVGEIVKRTSSPRSGHKTSFPVTEENRNYQQVGGCHQEQSKQHVNGLILAAVSNRNENLTEVVVCA